MHRHRSSFKSRIPAYPLPAVLSGSVAHLRRIPREWLIVFSFCGVILLGTSLLLSPMASRTGEISLLDALFTATSATCVTGLIVVDTGSYFSMFGQIVILALIQAGGLGIITFSSFFAVLLGKRIPLKQHDVVRQTHSQLDIRFFFRLVKRIGLFTLVFEALGAVLLLFSWSRQHPWPRALWLSIFHSVSAFCNAGLSLFPNSLVDYQGNLWVNTIIMGLVFLGGIGFLVIYDVERSLLFRERLSLHSRLALVTSITLILVGTALFLLLEHRNVLATRTLGEQLLISLFHSVTPRTAGFNTIDVGQFTNSSLVLTMLLMFIGGSPGSTAGGIKTTTFAVFLALAACRFQGKTATNAFHRTVPEKVVNEVIAIVLISIGILVLFNFTLQWSETGALPHYQTSGQYMEITFESVSAFGTVGLSTGVTPRLSSWGKFQIILLMLIGRVGPLVIAVAIARRHRLAVEYEYYRENVMVG